MDSKQSLSTAPIWSSRLWIAMWAALGLALVCLAAPGPRFWDASPTDRPQPDVQPAALQAADNGPVGVMTIENVRVGQRVLAGNPTGDFDHLLGDEVDPATWRRLELRAPKQDRSYADVVLLRPQWWLEERAAVVGGTVYISVPECGIDGNAELLAIGPCPPIESGDGRVVIGTFKHQSATVIDVSVEGLDDPIGVTVNHPFWSDDRQDFVRADALHIGERLHGLAGSPCITAISPRGPPEPVYNLEVHGEHCYQVSSLGLIVHNTIPCHDTFIPIEHLVESGRRFRGPRSVDEALEHGLSIKDPQWPWRGLHATEGHHPLMQGKTFKQFWKERGLTPKEVDSWIVDLDTDIHRAITESGWWDGYLLRRIADEEAIHGTLGKDEVRRIAQELLDEISGWEK